MKKISIICVLLLLLCAKTLPGESQNSAPEMDELRGFFRLETYGSGKTKANSPISESIVFQEGGDGRKYAVGLPFFANLLFQVEYSIQGISINHMPDKATDADYRQIVQSAWPDFTTGEIKQVAKGIKDWRKRNPDMPFLLINSLERATPHVKVDSPDELALRMIKRVSPVYPAFAKQQRIEGAVTLEIVVDENGFVEQIKVVEGNRALRAAAVDAVRQWQYSPLVFNGRVLPVKIKLEVKFSLGGIPYFP